MLPIELLEGFEQRIATTQGRPACPVEITELPKSYNNVMSMFLRKPSKIIFNEALYDQASEIDIMAALFHEIRHAYQLHVVENQRIECEPKAIIEGWQNDFEHYQKPLIEANQTKVKKETKDAYMSFSIEVDALAFADLNIYRIYKQHLQIPEVMLEAVKKRQEDLKNKGDIIKI